LAIDLRFLPRRENMEYKNLVTDFIERTQQNLKVIEEINKKDLLPVYEVTQLINSLLGLLVFPCESYYDQIPEIPLAQLVQKGWIIPRVSGKFQQVENLRELMRYLRNSIAHTNIRFLSDGHELTGITLWNCRNREKNWQVNKTLPELKSLTSQFVDLLLSDNQKTKLSKIEDC